jgi:DNA-directed RNA polymerase alpha subunit
MKLKLFPFGPKSIGLQTTEDAVNSFLSKSAAIVLQVHMFSAEGENCLALLCEDAPEKISTQSVSVLCLSVRASVILSDANITTLDQLCAKSEQELMKYRNFGRKSLNEIKEKLANIGLELGCDYFARRAQRSS